MLTINPDYMPLGLVSAVFKLQVFTYFLLCFWSDPPEDLTIVYNGKKSACVRAIFVPDGLNEGCARFVFRQSLGRVGFSQRTCPATDAEKIPPNDCVHGGLGISPACYSIVPVGPKTCTPELDGTFPYGPRHLRMPCEHRLWRELSGVGASTNIFASWIR